MLDDVRTASTRIRHKRSKQEQDALVQQRIELNPHRPAVYEARTAEEGIPVWVLVSSLDAAGGEVQTVAAAYEIPIETVEAAALFFLLYDREIMARIEGNRRMGAASPE
jgi:uncharacterized protein (DUF433 family)